MMRPPSPIRFPPHDGEPLKASSCLTRWAPIMDTGAGCVLDACWMRAGCLMGAAFLAAAWDRSCFAAGQSEASTLQKDDWSRLVCIA